MPAARNQHSCPVAQRGTGDRWGWVLPLAFLSGFLSLLTNLGGIASGDDGVGYTAMADSILDGRGVAYFLEDPTTVWPPLFSALMAAVAEVTPLDTVSAAIPLQAVCVVLAVLLGNRLLRRTVQDHRLAAIGTVVIALGPVTIGFGHLLMTDLAFAVVLLGWMLALINYRESANRWWLAGAAALVWVGFGVRYVALYLLALGAIWLLLDFRRGFLRRLLEAASYCAVGVVVPLLWMLRNHSADGTWTGLRTPSARGPVDNAYDIVGTMGRWLLPGVLNGRGYLWAAVGIVVLGASAWLGWRVLAARVPDPDLRARLGWLLDWLGGPSGLLAVQAFGYLAYMWFVRSSVALNQLDIRLLNPAYYSLLALALVLVDRTKLIVGPDGDSPWHRRGLVVVRGWAVANVVLGLSAVVVFAAGHDFFAGNYESELFRDVRADPVLDSVPADCRLFSNLPNALYPALESQWSPRRTYLESDLPTDELQELAETIEDDPACLVWVDEEPGYGHLWQRDELEREVDLVPVASSDNVFVYRFADKG